MTVESLLKVNDMDVKRIDIGNVPAIISRSPPLQPFALARASTYATNFGDGATDA